MSVPPALFASGGEIEVRCPCDNLHFCHISPQAVTFGCRRCKQVFTLHWDDLLPDALAGMVREAITARLDETGAQPL